MREQKRPGEHIPLNTPLISYNTEANIDIATSLKKHQPGKPTDRAVCERLIFKSKQSTSERYFGLTSHLLAFQAMREALLNDSTASTRDVQRIVGRTGKEK